MKSKYIYFLINLLGIVINFSLIITIVKGLNFEVKSTVSVASWSFIGYFIKTWIFTTPILKMKKFNYKKGFKYKILYSLFPFIFMILWFGAIVLFRIDSLYFDFSFGYFQRYPHGLIQILTMFIMSLLSIIILLFTRKGMIQKEASL